MRPVFLCMLRIALAMEGLEVHIALAGFSSGECFAHRVIDYVGETPQASLGFFVRKVRLHLRSITVNTLVDYM